jgi:hypothetical protein
VIYRQIVHSSASPAALSVAGDQLRRHRAADAVEVLPSPLKGSSFATDSRLSPRLKTTNPNVEGILCVSPAHYLYQSQRAEFAEKTHNLIASQF